MRVLVWLLLLTTLAGAEPRYTIHGVAPGPRPYPGQKTRAQVEWGLADGRHYVKSVQGDRLERDGRVILTRASRPDEIRKALGEPAVELDQSAIGRKLWCYPGGLEVSPGPPETRFSLTRMP